MGLIPGRDPVHTLVSRLSEQYALFPLQMVLQQNLNHSYTYTQNNPIRYIDPTGEIITILGPALVGGIAQGGATLLMGGSLGDVASNFAGGFLLGAAAGATFGLSTGVGQLAGGLILGVGLDAITAGSVLGSEKEASRKSCE